MHTGFDDLRGVFEQNNVLQLLHLMFISHSQCKSVLFMNVTCKLLCEHLLNCSSCWKDKHVYHSWSDSDSEWHLLYFKFVAGTLSGVEINFEDRKDGYFLKPVYTRYRPAEDNMERETFILTHPAELYKLRANLGPFDVYQAVPNDFVDGSHGVDMGGMEDRWGQKFMHRQIIYNMDVSAHLVMDKLFLKQPLLQVLIHAQPLIGRKKQDLIYSYYGYSQQWCGQLFVQHGMEQFSSVCVLSEDHDACVAGIRLPESWWRKNSTQVSVYYDISRVEENQECASASNTIIPARSLANSTNKQRKFIATVPLVEEDRAYQEETDQDLILRIPTRGYRPGTSFEVPVLLERNSGLQVFVIR